MLIALGACDGDFDFHEPTRIASHEEIIAIEGLDGDSLRICFGASEKPRGRVRVRNISTERLTLRFSGNGVIVIASNVIEPGSETRLEVEAIRFDDGPLSFSIQDAGGRFDIPVPVTLIADVRLLEVPLVARMTTMDGLDVTVQNPTPFVIHARLEGTGRWIPRLREEEIEPRRATQIDLVHVTGSSVRAGVAAELRIDGERCPDTVLPELPVVIVPTGPRDPDP